MCLERHNLAGHLAHLSRLRRLFDGLQWTVWHDGVEAAYERAERDYNDLGPEA